MKTEAKAVGYTVGPWQYDEEWSAITAEGQDLAIVRGTEADARLMLAAPELLEALNMFLALDPRCHRGVTSCGECAACLAHKAIAKAEGRQ